MTLLNERWLEMDLYWFQGASVDGRIEQLFDRLTPLWGTQDEHRKGLALCVGWLFDLVLEWNGDLDSVIPCCQAPTYDPWTYGQLATLLGKIREEACRRKLNDFHIALILMGIETQSFPESACEGWSGRTEETREKAHYDIVGRWFPAHREVYDSRFDIFSFGAPVTVPDHEAIYEGQPTTFGDYFATKLVAVCRATGFDAVVFRDNVFTRAYVRGYSKGRYMSPSDRADWNAGIIAMLSRVRKQSPNLVLIGYSSGTSSVEEWRSHGFDLEQVATAGCLDLWITQTWASAWGDYWPAHSMGFTFQLMNAMVHQAMLANTPCKHLFLIETFDAWEPWDSIHQYPSKVKWEIWAYSHTAVLLPHGGISRSGGCYISWMNRRSRLLPKQTVALLSKTLQEVEEDLVREPVPGGPCVVYPRTAYERSLDEPTERSRGEEVDDWAAMIIKFGAPVLSITRSEWLDTVDAEGYLCPVPEEWEAAHRERMIVEAGAGKPVLTMGEIQEEWPGCAHWRTPEWGTPFELHMSFRSIGSPVPYVDTAQTLWGGQPIRWANDDWSKPVCFHYWAYTDGSYRVLLANLETGITGNSQFCVGGVLSASAKPTTSVLGAPGKIWRTENGTAIRLGAHRATMVTIPGAGD